MFSKVPRITLRSRPPSKLIDYNTLAASLFSPFVNLSFSLSHSFILFSSLWHATHAGYLERISPPVPFLSLALTHSHGEFYIPWVSCWLPSRVGLRFRCSVPLLPSEAVPLPSLLLFHSRSFSSLVLRIPFNSLSVSPSHPFPLLPHRHLYISWGSFAHHRLAAVLASRESEFLSAAPPFLAFSLRLYLLLSFRPWPSSVLSGFLRRLSYPRYTCIPVHFVSTRTIAHLSFSFSFLSLSCFPFLLLPLVPRKHVREVCFSLTSLSLPPRQPAHSFSSFFLPRSVSPPVPDGCVCPPSPYHPPMSSPSFALLYRTSPPSSHLPLLPSRLCRALSSFPCRSFAHGF